MLAKLFPRRHSHYASLPILGTVMNGFVRFHVQNGYSRIPTKRHIRAAGEIDAILREKGCRSLKEMTREELHACGPPPGHSQDNINIAATLKLLERYFDDLGLLPEISPNSLECKVQEYGVWLKEMRGLAKTTILQHSQTARWFLESLDSTYTTERLSTLTANDIEEFVKLRGKRVSRASLQHNVAHLRSFLRFLAMIGEAPMGLDQQIDTPRLYRDENLPKTIPWESVQALVDSIDRKTIKGRRDFAILQLIISYGLRACDVVGLKLDDLNWRSGLLVISQRKTATPVSFPLVESVGESIIDWLRNGRPDLRHREVFVRLRGPHGALKPTAVADIVQFWSRRAGITLPSPKGTHFLRHCFAGQMIRQGISMKTIGDLLGHRCRESTCVYIRLGTDDLRDVALNLPKKEDKEVPT